MICLKSRLNRKISLRYYYKMYLSSYMFYTSNHTKTHANCALISNKQLLLNFESWKTLFTRLYFLPGKREGKY